VGNLTNGKALKVGNFLALLKVILQYDYLLASHLQHTRKNPRYVSYLSPEIQNEFMSSSFYYLGKKLLSDTKMYKYYGLLFVCLFALSLDASRRRVEMEST
jgi:hypothetical protein